MKTIIILMITVLISSLSARSKPVPGFTVFLFGEPAQGRAFTNQLPHGESAVSCLVQADNGLVFAGTRVVHGKTPWLAYFDPVKKSVPSRCLWPLDRWVAGQKCITALVCGPEGVIYGATSDLTDIDYADQADVNPAKYPGGRLFCFKPDTGAFEVKDLGAPFKGEGIGALAADTKRGVIYGITVPSLIVFSISDQKAVRLGDLGGVEVWRHLYIGKAPRALGVDDAGRLFGSAPGGKLFQYDPRAQTMSVLETLLPTEGEGHLYDAVSAFVKTASGRIFGGTFLDGKLFELFPETGKVKALGMTGRTGHVRGLAEKGGVLYGFTGSRASGSSFFSYHIDKAEFEAFPGFKVYFKDSMTKWVPFQLEDILLMKDGVFVAGENDDNGHLFIYECN
jgi:hypothetical protein